MHKHLKKSDFSGALECARYAFMPNQLNFCGGDKSREIFDYTAGNFADPHLESLLKEFATLYPYLKFIADINHLSDPFNQRVVESYWLGNELLTNNLNPNKFRDYFLDGLALKKMSNPKLVEKVIKKIPQGALPHHNFHVFNIPKRTGHYPVEHSLVTLDKCRISWGQILKIENDFLEVNSQPLILKAEELILGPPRPQRVRWRYQKKNFLEKPAPGDRVSLHWDWVCDRLTLPQTVNLEKYTRLALKLFSE